MTQLTNNPFDHVDSPLPTIMNGPFNRVPVFSTMGRGPRGEQGERGFPGEASRKDFETVAKMVAEQSLETGDICRTLGFHAAGDGGAAWYQVTDDATANEMDILALDNGLYAVLQITEAYVTPEMFGAYGDGEHDDSAAIQYGLDTYKSVKLLGKTYLLNEEIAISESNTNLNGVQNETILKQTASGENAVGIHGTASNLLQNVCISNITIIGDYAWDGTVGNGSASTLSGIFAEYCALSFFTNLNLQDNGTNGFECGARFWANVFDNCRFYRNKVNGFDSSNIYEDVSNRTASTLRFVNCYFAANVVGYKLNGNSVSFIGGWFEQNNYGVSSYQNTPGGNLGFSEVDFEGNYVTAIELNSIFSNVTFNGGNLQHSGTDEAITFTSSIASGIVAHWVFNTPITISSGVDFIDLGTITTLFCTGIPLGYFKAAQLEKVVIGSGTKQTTRNIVMKDVRNSNVRAASSILLKPNEQMTIVPFDGSRISRITFVVASGLHLKAYYQYQNSSTTYNVNTSTTDGREVFSTSTQAVTFVNENENSVIVSDVVISYYD